LSVNENAYDSDILFNKGEWQRCIKSQERLFSLEGLTRVSDSLRRDFHQGHGPNRELPQLHRNEWAQSFQEVLVQALPDHQDTLLGYDLPCLLSLDRPALGCVMLCAQDPLRKASKSLSENPYGEVTVGTFFGIDNNRFRQSYRHYPMIWRVIRSCLESGFDVWVTDAIKLYAGEGVVKRSQKLFDLCKETLREEIALVKPTRVLAMGNDAKYALSAVDPSLSFNTARHPSPRAWTTPLQSDQDLFEGALSREQKLDAKVRYYLRMLYD
jgi:hypothetical protein